MRTMAPLAGVVLAIALLLPATSLATKPIVSEKLAGLTAVQPAVAVVVSEKLAGLGFGSAPAPPLVSEKLAGLQLGEPETALATTSGGFDWGDAAVGAGVTFAALLAAAAVVATVRRQHGTLAH